jgi:hypothetical protein
MLARRIERIEREIEVLETVVALVQQEHEEDRRRLRRGNGGRDAS